jgi:hypothetical protein
MLCVIFISNAYLGGGLFVILPKTVCCNRAQNLQWDR